MTAEAVSKSKGSLRAVPVLAMIVGAALVGLGLLIVPQSALGGSHIGAIGLSLILSGLVATEWAAERWNLSPAAQRQWSLGFAVVAGALLVLFILVNWASFEGAEFEEST